MPEDASCRVTRCGNVVDFTVKERDPAPPGIVRISKDEYMVLASGEVKQFEHHETRAGNVRELRRTFGKLRAMINANCGEPRDLRMFTFTYRENMQDIKRLYVDFGNWWHKWKRYCARSDIPRCRYIAVPEPQGRGAWHLHCILIWDNGAPEFISFREVGVMWGHGWVDQRLGSGTLTCDNLGAYFTAYFANIPVDEYSSLPASEQVVKGHVELIDRSYYVDGVEVSKKFVKGARFYLYPVGMQIFRHSRDCQKPHYLDCKFGEACESMKKAGVASPTFSRNYDILGANGEIVNRVLKQSYNLRRPDGKLL